MIQCICCKRNESHIIINANFLVHICGQPDCTDQKGQKLGDWLIDEHESSGGYYIISGIEEFTMEIDGKSYIIKNDKRIIKSLHNKIQEIQKHK